MDTKAICGQVIYNMLSDIITQERMGEYLIMLSRFPQLSFENILLLLAQFPNATAICGDGAWKRYHAKVKPGQQSIALLGPVVEMTNFEDEDEVELEGEEVDNSICLGVMAVHDISQVDCGADTPNFYQPKKLGASIFDDLLRSRYGITIAQDINNEHLTSRIIKSRLNEDEGTLYLLKGLSDEIINVELLKCYVKLCVEEKDFTDFVDELEVFAIITIASYFKMPRIDTTIRHSELFTASQNDKRLFLQRLSEIVFEIITDLSEERVLSFNQTAFCNIFFASPDMSDTISEVGLAADMADTTDLHNDLLNFFNWMLNNINQNTYAAIRSKRNQRILFSFPPVKIESTDENATKPQKGSARDVHRCDSEISI